MNYRKRHIIKDIENYFIFTWQLSKTVFIMEMIGALSCLAATALATYTAPNVPMQVLSLLWITVSTTFGIASVIRKSPWMILLDSVNFVLNLITVFKVWLF